MLLSQRADWEELRNQFEPEVCRLFRLIGFELRADGMRWCSGIPGSHSETSFGTTGDFDPAAQRHTLLFWLRIFCGVDDNLYEIALAKLLDTFELISYRDVELWEQIHEWQHLVPYLTRLSERRFYPNQHKEV